MPWVRTGERYTLRGRARRFMRRLRRGAAIRAGVAVVVCFTAAAIYMLLGPA